MDNTGSIGAIQSCNVLESGSCFASNNDTTSANKTVKLKTSFDYASNLSESGNCVSANGTSNVPVTADTDSSRACVSTNDNSTTPETGDCHTDNASINNAPNTPEPLKSLAASVTCEKLFKDTCHISTEFINDCKNKGLSGNDIMQMIMDVELNGNILMQATMELRHFKDKGLFTTNIRSEIQNAVKKTYAKAINIKDHHESLQMLKDFSGLEYHAGKAVANVDNVKSAVTLKFLSEDEQISKKMLNVFEKLDKGKDDIQRKMAKLKPINIPGIVDSLTILEEAGFLSELLLCKVTSIAREIIELSTFIADHIRLADATVNGMNGVNFRDRKKGSSNKYDGEKQLKKLAESSKVRICKSEHNLPFCGNCGWRTSWVKAFKKRGVYVKEAATGDDKHIWVNSNNET